MPVKYWLFPDSKSPARLWNYSSNTVCGIAGVIFKVYLEYCNKSQIYNREILTDTLDKMRKEGRPFITLANHSSCIDDPTTLGMLKWRQVMNGKRLRWVSVADEICFFNKPSSTFFSLGKSVPTIRGEGVYQKPMDFLLEKLNQGGWVHIFPEGKVNLEKSYMRLKWGIGRLIADANICPLVLPYYHIGMDEVLPNTKPYIPQFRKKVTILVGNPIDFAAELQELKKIMSPIELRKYFTDKLQNELYELRKKTEKLHKDHIGGR